MTRLLGSVLLLCWCLASIAAAEEQQGSLTVYVQLIRGTNQEKPEQPTWKPVGPKLSRRLSPVFRWKHYWEVDFKELDLEPKRVKKLRLGDIRHLELELVNDHELEFRLFRKGKLTRTSRQKARSLNMEIIGGTRDDETSWFAVIRRHKPQRDRK